MKKVRLFTAMTIFITLLSSCEVIGGIFKAGVWSGIIMVAVVVVLIIWLITKFMGGSR